MRKQVSRALVPARACVRFKKKKIYISYLCTANRYVGFPRNNVKRRCVRSIVSETKLNARVGLSSARYRFHAQTLTAFIFKSLLMDITPPTHPFSQYGRVRLRVRLRRVLGSFIRIARAYEFGAYIAAPLPAMHQSISKFVNYKTGLSTAV